MLTKFLIKSKPSHGFTIVELLIVIVVIGILAAIVIVAYNGVQLRARDTNARSDINANVKAIEAYYIDKGVYPKLWAAAPNDSGFNDPSGAWPLTNVSGVNKNSLLAQGAPASANSSFVESNGSNITSNAVYGYIAYQADGTTCFLNSHICKKALFQYYSEQNKAPVTVNSLTGW